MSVIVAFIGPFDTFDRLAIGARFAYWLGVVLVATVHWRAVAWVVRRFIGEERPWPLAAVDRE